MAGFLSNKGTFGSRLSKTLRKISGLGVDYSDLVRKNSVAKGISQQNFVGAMSEGDPAYAAFMAATTITDTIHKSYIPFFDKEYISRRDELRKFSKNGEVEFVLDTIADEAISMNERNFFAEPTIVGMELKEKYAEALQENYKRIYYMLGFGEQEEAFNTFKQWLIDGVLAYEIIYDDKGTKIVGFKELDPAYLEPSVEIDSKNRSVKVWYQQIPNSPDKIRLLDSQVIYVSYSKHNFTSRRSYVERLVRSFNLLRLMEHTRVIWSIMNTTFRMKTLVPVGSRSEQKSRQIMEQFKNVMKEEVSFDDEAGSVSVNGQAGIQFYKNYILPNPSSGNSPEIESIAFDGPDLSDTDALKWFRDRFILDSKIPSERFDRESGGGSLVIGADGINRDEIRFSKFINRLRSGFSEILRKPLYCQMAIDFPDLAEDAMFKTNLGLRYNSDNLFEYLKRAELLDRQIGVVESLNRLEDGEGNPIFAPMALIRRFVTEISPTELEDMISESEKERSESEETAGDDAGADEFNF